MKKRFSALSLFIATLSYLLLTTGILAAQKPTASGSAATRLPYCDQVKDMAQKSLQARANLECQTIYQCVDCIDRANQTPKCTPVVVQPDPTSKCRVQVTVANEMAQNPQKTSVTPEPGATLNVDIFQAQCFNGRLTLQALVCTTPNSKCDDVNHYKYAWEVDGKPAGNGWSLDCVSGKAIKVTVTEIATGQSATKTLSVKQQVSPERTTTKLVAAYKKTSCFGRCPVFTMEIWDNGNVSWTGQMNVSPLGKKSAKAPANALTKLQEKAKAVKFYDMDDRYPKDPILDAPATVLYLNFDGKEKQVVDVAGAPAALKELEDIFDEIMTNLSWGNPGNPKPTDTTPPGKKQQVPSNGN